MNRPASTRYRSTRLAWAILMLTLLCFGVGAVLLLGVPPALLPHTPAYWSDLLLTAVMLAYAVTGFVIVSRRPGNVMGWLFAVIGLSWELRTLAGGYVYRSLAGAAGSVAAIMPAAWFFANAWIIPLALLPLIVALFPTGRFLSRPWQITAWLVGLCLASQFVADGLNPELELTPLGRLPALIQLPGAGRIAPLAMNAGGFAWLAAVILGVASMTVRFRRSKGEERLQIKWMAYASLLVGLVMTALAIAQFSPALNPGGLDLGALLYGVPFALAVAAPPSAAAVAMTRYHLYDIDLLINRTLVYGALTACVVGLYVLAVGGAGILMQERGNPIVSLVGAGVVAVLFGPLRDRLQRAVNRMMYGGADDPYQVLSRLGQRLALAVAANEVLPVVAHTIRDALRLPYAAITLQQGGEAVTAAQAGRVTGQPLTIPLVYQSERVGELALGPRRAGEGFNPAERQLLEDLAHQAGIVAHSVRLNGELQRSRERLVLAREEELRRLRRDLHDGLGPQLAGLTLKLETARNRLGHDPLADTLLSELTVRTQAAVADIRRLVYALRPPVLDELGLVAALREAALQYSEPGDGLQISVEGLECLAPLPAAVEVAAYRIAQEALTNAVRHSGAHRCTVRLEMDESRGELRLEVEDDGNGLPTQRREGIGLTAIRERAEELGGRWALEAPSAGGTRVVACLPAQHADFSTGVDPRLNGAGSLAEAGRRGRGPCDKETVAAGAGREGAST